jgi:hypothetical protein
MLFLSLESPPPNPLVTYNTAIMAPSLSSFLVFLLSVWEVQTLSWEGEGLEPIPTTGKKKRSLLLLTLIPWREDFWE